MSVSDVASRIQQIQSQIALLSPASTDPAAAASFSAALADAGTVDLAGAGTGTAGTAGAAGSTAALGTAGVAGTTEVATSAGTGSAEQAVVAEAEKYLGVPYVWGGTNGKTGLDCSGLVQLVYKQFGIDLPRVSYQQAREGTAVPSLAQARPGDVLAFGSPVHHVAIYIGDNKMIEAPRPGKNVQVSPVYETPTAIRRVLPQTATSTAGVAGAQGTSLRAGTPYASLFQGAAARHGVPASLLAAVAHQESGYNPSAVSPAGARGLMQLMPATARGLGVDPMNPSEAVEGAARMLRTLTNEFGSTSLALAAYNAGPGAVHRYNGIPPYGETQRYVPAVLDYQKVLQAA